MTHVRRTKPSALIEDTSMLVSLLLGEVDELIVLRVGDRKELEILLNLPSHLKVNVDILQAALEGTSVEEQRLLLKYRLTSNSRRVLAAHAKKEVARELCDGGYTTGAYVARDDVDPSEIRDIVSDPETARIIYTFENASLTPEKLTILKGIYLRRNTDDEAGN